MELKEPHIMMIISAEDIESLKRGQEQILGLLNQLKSVKAPQGEIMPGYVIAQKFMDSVGISRWKFDQLISDNKIRTIKKKRKIYVQVGEIDRYFTDPSIQ